MPIRKPTPEERAELIRLVKDFITTHGRGSFKRAVERAEIELTPALTPGQQRRADSRALWEQIDREIELEKQAKQAAAKAAYERMVLTQTVRHEVYEEEGIFSGIVRDPLRTIWSELEITRWGLHKSIRATLWARGMARDDATFRLRDAGNMLVGIEALIAWERRHLGMWSRRLEREGDRFKARQQREALRPVEEVRRLSAEGHGATEIAKRVGISRKSVWRIVRAGRMEQGQEATQREEL